MIDQDVTDAYDVADLLLVVYPPNCTAPGFDSVAS